MHRNLCGGLGNICRSPAALPVAVWSAGTSSRHVGMPPHPPMIRAAAARGYDLAALRARQADLAVLDPVEAGLAAPVARGG